MSLSKVSSGNGSKSKTGKRSTAEVSFIGDPYGEDFLATPGKNRRLSQREIGQSQEDWIEKYLELEGKYEELIGQLSDKDEYVKRLEGIVERTENEKRVYRQELEKYKSIVEQLKKDSTDTRKLLSAKDSEMKEVQHRLVLLEKSSSQQTANMDIEMNNDTNSRLSFLESSLKTMADSVKQLTDTVLSQENRPTRSYADAARIAPTGNGSTGNRPVPKLNGRPVNPRRSFTADDYVGRFENLSQEEILQKKAEYYQLIKRPDAVKNSQNAGEKKYNVSFIYVKNINFMPIKDVYKLCNALGMNTNHIRWIRYAKVNQSIGLTVTEFLVNNSYVSRFRALLPTGKPILEDFDPEKPWRTDHDQEILEKVRLQWRNKLESLCKMPRNRLSTQVFREWGREIGVWNNEKENEANDEELSTENVFNTNEINSNTTDDAQTNSTTLNE
jgi:hypothetical protein